MTGEAKTTLLPIRTKNVSFDVGESTSDASSDSSGPSSSSEPEAAPSLAAAPPEQPPALERRWPANPARALPPLTALPRERGGSGSNWALRNRDLSAIEYSKSLLSEGDTLVVIQYPNGQDLYDPAGFKVSKTNHRVHSEKLLATGSQKFQKLLGERDQQRARKRAGYGPPNELPPGVKYVLDLTPPDEGDDAVDLTSNLSCSPGIRLWAKTASLIGVEKSHVSGQDEFVRIPHYPIDEKDASTSTTQDEDEEEKVYDNSPSGELADIPEYCPIRHRGGIERLLRLIEGRDPKLDSAPKILTLAVLAKFFDCTKVVAGYIESWIVVEPNNKFIEILPEEAFKIGLYLNSKMIIEPAFAVLVSEGAFLAAARMQPSFSPRKDNATQFGRLKGDINEDELNRIEAAANDFQSRINGAAAKLMDPSMAWIEDLPEFRKILRFKESTLHDARSQQAVNSLVNRLGHYTRGQIMAVEMQSLTAAQNFTANGNRGFEHYLDFYFGNFEDLYDTFSPDERYLTRFYWDLLRALEWGTKAQTSPMCNSNLSRQMRREVAAAKGVEQVTITDLMDAQEHLNNVIRVMGGESGLLDGTSDSSLAPETPTTETEAEKTPTRKTILDKFWDFDSDSDEELLSRPSVEPVPGPATEGLGPAHGKRPNPFCGLPIPGTSKAKRTWTILNEHRTQNYLNLPYFSLVEFMAQIQVHIASVCRSMLQDPYFGVASFVDTLVCMSREELKYLPLWAGGNEDGTGGVFEKPIPPAEFGVAPNGPGPAYHTGLSVFSQASSVVEVDEDDQMTEVGTVNTSIAVDNGLSGHVDRRAIISDFGSIASFVHVSEHEGRGKEKEIKREEMILPDLYENMETDSVDTYDFKLSDIDSSSTVSREVEESEDDFMMVSDEDEDEDIEIL